MDEVVKVACVGAGYFAQFHHDAWRRLEGVSLDGIADPALAENVVAGTPVFKSAQAMLEKLSPTIVDIITPPATHGEMVPLALRSSASVVICQKPFGTDLGEARRLVKMANDVGKKLIVHENFRFQPWYRKARDVISNGLLGRVHQAQFRMRPGDGRGPDAYLARQPYFQRMPRFLIHETGVHWIDTFRYLLGEPEAVYADLRRLNSHIDGEDAGYFILGFPDGLRALYDANRLLDFEAEDYRLTMGEMVIEGEAGSLRLDGFGCLRFREAYSQDVTELLSAKQWPGFAGDCVFYLQKHIVDALNGRCPFENEADAYLRNIEIEEIIYQSAESGRRIGL